jgi:enoyl-CoA hydratase/carnithine racemase
VLVFKSADADYFISHVDLTKIDEYREVGGEADRRSVHRAAVSVSEREPPRYHCADRGACSGRRQRIRAGGDMRFAARESAIFSQPPAFGQIPGAGGARHLVRLMGRASALELMYPHDADDASMKGLSTR